MKSIAFAVAGLIAATGLAPVAASAQTRTVVTHTETRHVESHSRGPAHRTRRVCTVHYDHHRKVRTCRTVRY
jgi:hypothetical protein